MRSALSTSATCPPQSYTSPTPFTACRGVPTSVHPARASDSLRLMLEDYTADLSHKILFWYPAHSKAVGTHCHHQSLDCVLASVRHCDRPARFPSFGRWFTVSQDGWHTCHTATIFGVTDFSIHVALSGLSPSFYNLRIYGSFKYYLSFLAPMLGSNFWSFWWRKIRFSIWAIIRQSRF